MSEKGRKEVQPLFPPIWQKNVKINNKGERKSESERGGREGVKEGGTNTLHLAIFRNPHT